MVRAPIRSRNVPAQFEQNKGSRSTIQHTMANLDFAFEKQESLKILLDSSDDLFNFFIDFGPVGDKNKKDGKKYIVDTEKERLAVGKGACPAIQIFDSYYWVAKVFFDWLKINAGETRWGARNPSTLPFRMPNFDAKWLHKGGKSWYYTHYLLRHGNPRFEGDIRKTCNFSAADQEGLALYVNVFDTQFLPPWDDGHDGKSLLWAMRVHDFAIHFLKQDTSKCRQLAGLCKQLVSTRVQNTLPKSPRYMDVQLEVAHALSVIATVGGEGETDGARKRKPKRKKPLVPVETRQRASKSSTAEGRAPAKVMNLLSAQELTVDDIGEMSKSKAKSTCELAGLPCKGTKNDLVIQIREAYNLEKAAAAETDAEDETDATDGEEADGANACVLTCLICQQKVGSALLDFPISNDKNAETVECPTVEINGIRTIQYNSRAFLDFQKRHRKSSAGGSRFRKWKLQCRVHYKSFHGGHLYGDFLANTKYANMSKAVAEFNDADTGEKFKAEAVRRYILREYNQEHNTFMNTVSSDKQEMEFIKKMCKNHRNSK